MVGRWPAAEVAPATQGGDVASETYGRQKTKPASAGNLNRVVLAAAAALDVSQVWEGDADAGDCPQVRGLRISGGDVTTTGTPYSFDHCDECGDPLEPESRLWGLCEDCEESPEKKPTEGGS